MDIEVSGMSCGGCVSSVRRILTRELGEDENAIEVSLDDGRATVPEGIDRDRLEAAVQRLADAGFTATLPR